MVVVVKGTSCVVSAEKKTWLSLFVELDLVVVSGNKQDLWW